MSTSKRKHMHFMGIAAAIYIIFAIRGLSTHHYQDLCLDFIFVDNLEILIWLIPAAFLILKLVSCRQHYFKDAFWLAFYTTIPYLGLDWIFLGGLKGYGVDYFGKWWFLTLFYFILWIEFPIVGYLMQTNDRHVEKKHVLIVSLAVFCWWINYREGLSSNHFLEWTLDMKLMRLTNIPLILMFIAWLVFRHCSDQQCVVKDGCVMALYFSFVFVLCDIHYLAVYKKLGLSYWVDYWHVALFYPLFWLIFPATAWTMQRFAARGSRPEYGNLQPGVRSLQH